MNDTICLNPDVLSAMYIINNVITIIKVLVPVLIIITGVISLAKAVMSEDDSLLKSSVQMLITKFFIGAAIFFVPTIFNAIFSLVAPKTNFVDCFTKATPTNIQKAYLDIAMNKVAAAEKSMDDLDYSQAYLAVLKVKDQTAQKNLQERLLIVRASIQKEKKEKIREKQEKWDAEAAEAYTNLSVKGAYSTAGNGVAQPGVYQNSEPDPSAAINYWKKYLNPNDFIYPRDEKTGLPLGAWPKNYGSIKTQLPSYKTYLSVFIWPVTPSNNAYHFVYQHNGIDIMATVGTPIYSPADAKLVYSEWGHTVNRGGDETAYSVGLELVSPVVVGGKRISNIFLTHMSGIRYRCSSGNCNKMVRKGELLGFAGNAAGSAQSIGWAPHLHMTFYPANYSDGLNTTSMESIYNIPMRTGKYEIVAGG